jgi:hypothetical protein
MVKVNIDNIIDDEFFLNYLNFLINRVYKILPISEDEPETLELYLDSLVLELLGSKDLILKLKKDASFLSLIATLQSLSENQYTHKVIKSQVFRCIDIIKKLISKYKN